MRDERERQLTRREVIRLGAAGAAATCAAAAGPLFAAPAGQEKIPIGLQLYSVRRDCAKDFEGTLAAVAKIGYKGADFAGYYKFARNPKGLRKLLDDNGLVCCGTHTSLNTILGDALKRTIEFHKTLGNKFLIVSSMPGKFRKSRQSWLDAAKLFNEAAERAKADEMLVGYHNHSYEFKPIDGRTPWDIFFGNTTPEVVMQLDTGNCLGGGGDPVAIIKEYPGRTKTIHLKESGDAEHSSVGDGKVDWKGVFAACESVGGTEWYIVEQGRFAGPPLDGVRRCFENLRKMGKV